MDLEKSDKSDSRNSKYPKNKGESYVTSQVQTVNHLLFAYPGI